jgi:cell division protein FtsI/penicillin-binding protein 2
VTAASFDARREVYSWLYKTRHKNAQDTRIRIVLEAEAFTEIHRTWKRLGYPFDYLVPSYATAIGSSADRPVALAELMGIILSNGMRYPQTNIDTLHFAANTPFETVLKYSAPPSQRVIHPEIIRVVKKALLGVVEQGTAVRLNKVFRDAAGHVIPVGGKTGTGDHRYEVYGGRGRLISSRVVSRTATFAFFIGERFYGTVVAYVAGQEAEKFHFTSAVPAQLLKVLSPTLMPLINRTETARKAP